MQSIIFSSRVGTFPIDTTKTRLMIQGQVAEVAHTQLKYRGMLHAIVTISKEESVKALYSGCVSKNAVLLIKKSIKSVSMTMKVPGPYRVPIVLPEFFP